MKTPEEIRKLAHKKYSTQGSGGGQYTEGLQEGRIVGFIDGYDKCQQDNADKKYTEEDMVAFAYQFSSINVSDFRKHLKDFDLNLKEKNKQD